MIDECTKSSRKKPLITILLGMVVLPAGCSVPELTSTAAAANACDGPREVREVTRESLRTFIRTKQMTVLTFTGYSGAQYEDPAALLEQAAHVLDGQASAKP